MTVGAGAHGPSGAGQVAKAHPSTPTVETDDVRTDRTDRTGRTVNVVTERRSIWVLTLCAVYGLLAMRLANFGLPYADQCVAAFTVESGPDDHVS